MRLQSGGYSSFIWRRPGGHLRHRSLCGPGNAQTRALLQGGGCLVTWCCCLVLFFGEFPYAPEIKRSWEMKRTIHDGKISPSFQPKQTAGRGLPALTKGATDFVRLLLIRCKEDRPSAENVLTTRFLGGEGSFSQLPSLSVTFRYAMRSGAFESRLVAKQNDKLDHHLAQLYRRHAHGVQAQDMTTEIVKMHKSEKSLGSSDASTAASARTCSRSAWTSKASTTSPCPASCQLEALVPGFAEE